MNCQTCQFEIEEVKATERLSDDARTHLSVCAVCRAFHDERQALKKLVGSLEAVSAPADFDFRLRARLAAAKGAGTHHFSWRSFVASAQAVGIAAAFALLVAAVVFYNQTKKSAVTERPDVAAVQLPGQTQEPLSATPAPTAVRAPELSGEIGEDNGVPLTVANRRQPSRANVNGKQNVRRESSQPGVNDSQIISNDMASRPAPQIVPGNSAPFKAGMEGMVSLPVRSASQPMRVFVDERGGTKRTLTLEPVVFGSQDFTGNNTPRVASSQGIW